MARVRVGLIGRGTAGKIFHAPLIRAVPDLELAAVAGSDGAAALIADPAIDLVIVATPNATHFPLAQAALEAGKHVLVDKPFAVTLEEADALIGLAADRDRLLSVFHNRRWDGDFLTVRQVLGSGALGEVILYEACWDRFRPAIKQGWREQGQGEGTGLLFDLGPHLVDQALVLFGLPDAVSADIAVQRGEAAVDDYFAVILHYGRMRAVLAASTLALLPRPRFALSGTLGAFRSFDLDTQEAALKAGMAPGAPGFGAPDMSRPPLLATADGERQPVPPLPGRWTAFYEGVSRAIRDGAPVPVDPADARTGLHLLHLARRSAAEGRRLAVSEQSSSTSGT